MNVFSRAYVDSLFADYQQDPKSLPEQWQHYFANFDPAAEELNFETLPTSSGTPVTAVHNAAVSQDIAIQQDRVDQLIRGYRVRGHLSAQIDPLGRQREINSELSLESYGLTEADFEKSFSARTIDGENFRPLKDIVHLMQQTYCRSIGAQFCLLYTSPSPRDRTRSRMPSSA